jgi:hypothetical protein
MRVLWQAILLTSVTSSGCMSSSARTHLKRSSSAAVTEDPQTSSSVLVSDTAPSSAPELDKIPAKAAPLRDVIEPAETKTQQSSCEHKASFEKPIFIAEAQALVIKMDQDCKTNANGVEYLSAKLSALGVSCTGGPGLVARKGHSNQNWEVINFKLDLSCAMRSSEELRLTGKKKLGLAVEPVVRAFVPLMVDYWEFEKNNDAGLGATPTLSERGGGAQQWNKGVQKSVNFPVKLYGRF